MSYTRFAGADVWAIFCSDGMSTSAVRMTGRKRGSRGSRSLNLVSLGTSTSNVSRLVATEVSLGLSASA